MPVIPQTWRDYVHRNPVQEQRQWTAHFLAAEGLSAVALKGGTKIFDTTDRAIEHWYDQDLPAWQNWAAPLMASNAAAITDVDIDGKPGAGLTWTPELKAELRFAQLTLVAAFQALGPVDAPAFGRAFFDFYGHHIVHCTLDKPDEMDVLRRLTMRRPIPFGDLMLRLEVRVAANKGDPSKRAFTLPGSVYMQPDDDTAMDLIGWKAPRSAGLKIGRTAVSTLHRCLYAWLLAIAARGHWKPGVRHEASLYFTGLLAHEVNAGFLDKEQAEAIWKFVLSRLNDPDTPDRIRVLRDSLEAIEKGRPVSGYGKIAELVGEDMRLALLHMRGGSDPDAINEMFRRVVLVQRGETAGIRYCDISGSAHTHQEITAEQMLRWYANHPDFPPLPGKKNTKTPIIAVVLNSPRIRRVDGIVAMPGEPYGGLYWRDGHTFHRITDEAPAETGAEIYLNKAEGMPAYTAPTEAEAAQWTHFWTRHLEPLGVTPEDRMRLEHSIAMKVQRPQHKYHRGIAITGGQGIGKSAVFDVVLRALYGPSLVSKTTGADLKEKFKFQTLGTSLFYAIEEVHFPGLDGQTHELFKNLLKNDTMPIEHKYGKKGDERNVAMPYFLTNSDDPGIIVDGKPERALAIVKGMSHEVMGGPLANWAAYVRVIENNVGEFDAALRTNPRLRNAGRHYFATLKTDEALFASIITDTPPDHLRNSLPPLEQCLLDMFEEQRIRPGRTGWPITGPFKLSMLKLGIEERMRARGLNAGNLSERGVAMLLRRLFNEDVTAEAMAYVVGANGERLTARLRYFKYSQAKLFALLKRNRNLELSAPYDFDPATPEAVDAPSQETLVEAWRVSQNPNDSGAY